jgi:hypothetical protein
MAQRINLSEIFPEDGNLGRSNNLRGNASSIIPYIGKNKGAKRHFPETKARTILTLEMRGKSKTLIAEMMHISIQGVINIVQSPEYKAMREHVLREMDHEFLAMKPLAFDAIENGLKSSDENVSLKAADMWFKGAGFGSYSKTPAVDPSVTAEDVVRNLLQVNVNVSVAASEARIRQSLQPEQSSDQEPDDPTILDAAE